MYICFNWCSCLRAIRKLQKFGHLPSDPSLYKSYAIEGNFIDVRLSALEALVDYTAGQLSSSNFQTILLIFYCVVWSLKTKIVRCICVFTDGKKLGINFFVSISYYFNCSQFSQARMSDMILRLWPLIYLSFYNDIWVAFIHLKCDIKERNSLL